MLWAVPRDVMSLETTRPKHADGELDARLDTCLGGAPSRISCLHAICQGMALATAAWEFGHASLNRHTSRLFSPVGHGDWERALHKKLHPSRLPSHWCGGGATSARPLGLVIAAHPRGPNQRELGSSVEASGNVDGQFGFAVHYIRFRAGASRARVARAA